MDKTAFYDLSYGVYLCTSWDEGKPVGCVANSAMQITSQPATIAVSLNKNNYTHKAVSESGHFALTVLGESADPRLRTLRDLHSHGEQRSLHYRHLRLPHVQGVR